MSLFLKARKKLGLTQAQMADRVGLARQTWQLLEYGQLLPSAEVAEHIYQLTAIVVPCLTDCISSKDARTWATVRPYEFEKASLEIWARVHEKCENMTELYRQIPASLVGWMENMLACESFPEGFGLLQFALAGAGRMLSNPHELGYRGQPIIDARGQLLGERKLPGLQGRIQGLRYLLWPQVGLRPRSATFRLDGLMLVQAGASCIWCDLEFDSSLHDLARDQSRAKLIGLPEIRLSEQDVEAVRVVERVYEQALALFTKAA